MIRACAIAFVAMTLAFAGAGCGTDVAINPFIQWEAIDSVDMTPLVDEVATLVAQGVVTTNIADDEEDEDEDSSSDDSSDTDTSDYSDLIDQYTNQ